MRITDFRSAFSVMSFEIVRSWCILSKALEKSMTDWTQCSYNQADSKYQRNTSPGHLWFQGEEWGEFTPHECVIVKQDLGILRGSKVAFQENRKSEELLPQRIFWCRFSMHSPCYTIYRSAMYFYHIKFCKKSVHNYSRYDGGWLTPSSEDIRSVWRFRLLMSSSVIFKTRFILLTRIINFWIKNKIIYGSILVNKIWLARCCY